MDFVLAWINQDTVAIDVTLILQRFIWLTAIVEGDRVGPDVLSSLSYFLPIVLPVHPMPEEVVINVVLKTGPDRGTRIGRGSINNDRAGSGSTAVVDPVLSSARTLLLSLLNVVAERSCIPVANCTVEFFDVVLRYKSWESFSWTRIGRDILGEFANVLIFRPSRLVWQVEESDCARKVLVDERHPLVRLLPGIRSFIKV